MTSRAGLDYLNAIVRTRGYAHRSHRLLAAHDLALLRAVNEVTEVNYIAQRRLTEREKELVLVAAFATLRASGYIVAAHLRKAVACGTARADLFHALAACLPEAGYAAFESAFAAWRETFGEDEVPAPAAPNGTGATRMDIATLRRADPRLADAAQKLAEVADATGEALDARTRALIAVAVLVCARASDARVEQAMRDALAAGATPQDLLEALELLITPAGLPVFDRGLAIWAELTGAPALEPEVAPR